MTKIKKDRSMLEVMNSSPWLSINESLSLVNMEWRLQKLQNIPYTNIKNIIKDKKDISLCIAELENILKTFKDLELRTKLINENC